MKPYADYTFIVYARYLGGPVYIHEFESEDRVIHPEHIYDTKKNIRKLLEDSHPQWLSVIPKQGNERLRIVGYKFTRYFYDPIQIQNSPISFFEPEPNLTPDRIITIKGQTAHYTKYPVDFRIIEDETSIEIRGIANLDYPLANHAYLTASFHRDHGSLDGMCACTKLHESMSNPEIVSRLTEQGYELGARFVPHRGIEIMKAIMFKVAGIEERRLRRCSAYFIERRTQAALDAHQSFETTLGGRTYTAPLMRFGFPVKDLRFDVSGYNMLLGIEY